MMFSIFCISEAMLLIKNDRSFQVPQCTWRNILGVYTWGSVEGESVLIYI